MPVFLEHELRGYLGEKAGQVARPERRDNQLERGRGREVREISKKERRKRNGRVLLLFLLSNWSHPLLRRSQEEAA